MPDLQASNPQHGDALSRFVELADLQARLDLRCQFAGRYAVDHDASTGGDIVFHLVLQGRCVVELGAGAPVLLEAGDFLALPRGAAHRLRSVAAPDAASAPFSRNDGGLLPMRRNTEGAAELDLLCGRFNAGSRAADALFATLPGALHASLSPTRAELGAVVALIRSEVEAAPPGALAIVAALTRVLFTLALRVHIDAGTGQSGVLALLGDARLAAAAQAMLAEPGQDWSMEQLAALAALSRATFMRRFGEVAGMTPGDFLTALRIARAARLLRQTRRSTGDIGMEVGYRSESAFNKAFARVIGASPAAFRRED
ncbi:MAG: AraC family transcriptional regulator [Paucibacter sp.]|nr:AraC family transcriptional regulator [Roseateles sp.]